MATYNLVVLVGRLDAEPERIAGTDRVVLPVLVSRPEGQPLSLRVEVAGRQGEPCAALLHKGSEIMATGELFRADGRLSVRASRVEVLDGKAAGTAGKADTA